MYCRKWIQLGNSVVGIISLGIVPVDDILLGRIHTLAMINPDAEIPIVAIINEG